MFCDSPKLRDLHLSVRFPLHLLNKIPLEDAQIEAKQILDHATSIADAFCEELQDKENQEMRDLLEDVSYNIMKIAVKKELGEDC